MLFEVIYLLQLSSFLLEYDCSELETATKRVVCRQDLPIKFFLNGLKMTKINQKCKMLSEHTLIWLILMIRFVLIKYVFV